ncbi:Protein EXPORTIN 1A [Dictyocoela muelleri]|nr:Protein EXPORTIN 1A [Dictyocoela muelleri]
MSILNFNEPFDITEFDFLVLDALSPNSPTKTQSEQILMQFKESPSSIQHIDTILRRSKQKESILFSLMILDESVKTRWLSFPDEQRKTIKNYIINLIMSSCGGDQIVLKKLNHILIQIIKKEWPDKWPTFIDEIISASQSDIKVCSNTLDILRLLNDQINSENAELNETLTTVKKIKISRHLQQDNPKIINFIQVILQSEAKDQLLKPALKCLNSMIKEIDETFLFNSEIIELILFHISQAPVDVFECLFEISRFKIMKENMNDTEDQIDNQNNIANKTCTCLSNEICFHHKRLPENLKTNKLNLIHKITIQFLNIYFESKKNLSIVYQTLIEEEKRFIKIVSHFLSNFYEKKLSIFDPEIVIYGINHLLEISQVNDHEIFKVILNFWISLLSDLNDFKSNLKNFKNLNNYKNFKNENLHNDNQILLLLFKNRYILERLLNIFIYKMPRPTEILVVENEYGEIVKEKMTDTEMISFINLMKEGINLICSLIPDETQRFLLRDIKKDDNMENLNKVGWSIGSINLSKYGNKTDENELFISALKSLLNTCSMKVSKNDKAIIASLIIFLISQFTNFFDSNKKFFMTVIFKIFEFMDEEHEGIKDMACDAFENICKKRPQEFYTTRKDNEITIFYILLNLSIITKSLELYQKRSVFRSICLVIQSRSEVLKFQYRKFNQNLNNQNLNNQNLNNQNLNNQNLNNQNLNKNFDMNREINLLNLYLTRIGISESSSVKDFSHYFKICEILYSTFPNSLMNNNVNFGNQNSPNYNFSYDSLMAKEEGKIDYNQNKSENKIIIPPVFNLYGVIKNIRPDQNLRADMIYCFVSIVKSIPKITIGSIDDRNSFKKECISASLDVVNDFLITKEYLLFDLLSEIVNILEFNPQSEKQLSNDPHTLGNSGPESLDKNFLIDNFVLKNILPPIDDISDVDFANSYLNLLSSLLNNRYGIFFPLFFADEKLFEKSYNLILTGLMMKENIREKATDLLNLIFMKNFSSKNFSFFKKFYLLTLDNIFGVIFEGNYKSAINFLFLILNYREILESTFKITVEQHIDQLIGAFSNIPIEFRMIFKEGLFSLLGNEQLFADHVGDFRKRVQIIENTDEVDDEKKLLEMRIRCLRN